MNINQVFKTFCDNLHKRKELMTEDNVRYYWFAAMLKEDSELEHYTMEYPYDSSVFVKSSRPSKKELDFLYLNGTESYCMEIKFHRNPDLNSTFAHTDAAGSLFNDIIRLSIFKPGKSFDNQKNECHLPKNTRRFLLYVTDEEMNKYLGKKDGYYSTPAYRRELFNWYTMKEGGPIFIPHFDDVPNTFEYSTLDSLDNRYTLASIPPIQLLHNDTFMEMDSESFKERQCHIRLYEILN